MTANPPPVPERESDPDGFPTYPGFGSADDVQARIRLLQWIPVQLAAEGLELQVGDYVLATDGRILGFGPDFEELNRRIEAAEPEMRNARVVVIRIPPRDY
ncbi:MAG: hypothetical protein K8U57_04235 [Planctomycetes bacterium]|nr:hypothetical protein [Planctomycetota bacterium]